MKSSIEIEIFFARLLELGLFIVSVVGTGRTQRSSQVILEGFLEEEKVEDGGLGFGALSRDFTVGKCPLYLVTGEMVGFQRGFG